MLPEQVVCAADDEVDHLVRGVDDAEPVGGCGVVGFIKILVDGLEEALLFGVVGDVVCCPADCAVVGAEPVDGLAAHVAGEEGPLQAVEPLGDVVLAVELVLGEDAEEDVPGEDVLEEHLAHVGLRHVGADGLPAQLQEARRGGHVGLVLGLGLLDGLAEVLEDGWQVGLELLLGVPELLDLGQLVVEEAADEAV